MGRAAHGGPGWGGAWQHYRRSLTRSLTMSIEPAPPPSTTPGEGASVEEPVPAAQWTADDVLSGLDPDQRAVASEPLGPMCVLAGAGSGKTRAITHRIAYGVKAGAYAPGRVLAVTFTARAAGEMRTRLRSLGVPAVQARTFHSAALRQLRYFWPQAVGGAAPEIMAAKAPLVAESASRLRLSTDRAVIRDLSAEIEWAKVSMLTDESYPAAAAAAGRQVAGADHTTVGRLLAQYEASKTQRGVIDFEDVLLLMVGILRESGEVARTVRAQYRHFVVDEFQDVNAVQRRLLSEWVGERSDVCVVGDPAQTIYSFTGATPTHLLDFARHHPGARVVRLTRNYRSSPQVVNLANLVLGSFGGRGPHLELKAQGESGPAPTLTPYPDDEAEAAGVASSVAQLIESGIPSSSIAILYRTNAQSGPLEDALEDAGVAYLVRGGERFFSRPEVRRGLLLLRGAVRGDDGSVPLANLVGDVLTSAGWSHTAPAARGAVREQWESLDALVQLAHAMATTHPQARLRDLVADLGERAEAMHVPAVSGVTLSSLHASKGLEWDVVFVVGCSDGLLPIAMAEGSAAIEEERRLLYVGLTRARRDLRLTWAAARAPGGRATRRPSRFLDSAAEVLGQGARSRRAPGRSAAAAGPRRATRPKLCRGCGAELTTAAMRKRRRCDDCPPTYDPELFERMRTWRADVAKEAKVPAYVVFTDATLEAIAERCPTDVASLSSISGVGARKLALYGAQVLALVHGALPAEAARAQPGANEETLLD